MESSGTSPTSGWAQLTGAAAAVGASLCCLVPLVLVSVGIGGAWLTRLTALEPYRPWFAILSLAALGIAFWRLYGPASRCADGRVCADPLVLRRRRGVLWITFVFVAPLLLFPYYIGWFV